MLMTEIIEKKKKNGRLNREEIHFFIHNYVKDLIPDYQASALLMAIFFRGLDAEETAILTDEMMHSGKVVDLSKIPGIKVDKHSTGGVGDKTSLVLAPMVAACGVKVAKISGRGLGHTGGTIDKLESIPGFKTEIKQEDFIKQVAQIGVAIIGQSEYLVPADKKLYALRDVTATVNSFPLIAASIMSKKLATGSDAICLDVKYGSGAFCKNPKEAEKLANTMIAIGKHMKRDTRALITNMDEPLGLAIGNNLEVKEAIMTLKNKGPIDLRELCLEAGTVMLIQSKQYKDKKVARKALEEVLLNGKAFEKLVELVKAQGGDATYLEKPEKFALAKYVIPIYAKKTAYIKKMLTVGLGEVARLLGAGREKKEDKIDFSSGIIVAKKTGEKVEKGELLATLYTNNESVIETAKTQVLKCYRFSKKPTKALDLIWKILD